MKPKKRPPRAAPRSGRWKSHQNNQHQIDKEPPNRFINGTDRKVSPQAKITGTGNAATKHYAADQQYNGNDFCKNPRSTAEFVHEQQSDNADQTGKDEISAFPWSNGTLAGTLNNHRRPGGDGNRSIDERLRLSRRRDEDGSGLEADILNKGCLSSLFSWNNILVDGYHRHDICTKHKIPFDVKSIDFDDLDDAKLWIVKHQANRRNLTSFQRIEIALKFKPTVAEKARKNCSAGGGDRINRDTKPGLENLLVNFICDRFFDANDEVRDRILRTILQIATDGDSIEEILKLIEQEKKKSKLENTEA